MKVLITGLMICLFPLNALPQHIYTLDQPGVYSIPQNHPALQNQYITGSHLENQLAKLVINNQTYFLISPDRSTEPEWQSEPLNVFSNHIILTGRFSDQPSPAFSVTQTPSQFATSPPDTIRFQYFLETDSEYYIGDPASTNITGRTNGEGWIWFYLRKGNKRTITETLPVKPVHSQVDIEIDLKGVSRDNAFSPDHQLVVSGNGFSESVSFTGYDQPVFHFTFPTDDQNRLSLTFESVGFAGTTVDQIYIDRIRTSSRITECPDQPVFNLDLSETHQQKEVLTIYADSAAAFIVVDTVSNQVILPALGAVDEKGLRINAFQLNGLDKANLLVFNLSNPHVLPTGRLITNENLPLYPNPHMLIIAHPDFLNFSRDYADYRMDSDTIQIHLTTTDNIYFSRSQGQPSPSAIKSFIDAYKQEHPSIEFVLLVGNSSWDPRGIINPTENRHFIPSYGNPVSDQWYGALDPDNSYLATVSIGRLPINNESEGYYFLEKLKQFDQNKFRNPSGKSFLFINGGFNDYEQTVFLRQTENLISKYVHHPTILGRADTIIKRSEGIENAGEYTPLILNAFRKGMVWTNFIGHAGSRTWDLMLSDVNELPVSDGKFPFITSMTCFTGDIANPNQESFSESFVLAPDKGAIGFLGTSGLGYIDLDDLMVQKMFETGLLTDKKSMGHIVDAGRNDLAGRFATNSRVQSVVRQYTLIGDPSLTLPIASFPDLAITNRTIIKQNANDFVLQLELINLGVVQSDSIHVEIRDLKNQSVIFSFSDQILSSTYNRDITLPPLRPGSTTLEILVTWKGDQQDLNDLNNRFSIPVFVPENKLVVFNLFSNQIIPNEEKTIYLYSPETQSLEWSILTVDDEVLESGLEVVTGVDSIKIHPGINWINRHLILSFSASGDVLHPPISFKIDPAETGFNATQPMKWSSSQSVSLNKGQLAIDQVQGMLTAGSAGFDAGNFGYISVNDQPVYCAFRGIIAVEIDPITASILSTGEFDTYLSNDEAEALNDWINARLSTGHILAFAVKDEASNRLSSDLKSTLKKLGSTLIDSVGFREGWVFAALSGQNPEKLFEGWSGDQFSKAFGNSGLEYFPILTKISIPVAVDEKKLNRLTITHDSDDSLFYQLDNLAVQYIEKGSEINLVPLNQVDSVHFMVFKTSPDSSASFSFTGLNYESENRLGIQSVKLSKDFISVGEPVEVRANYFYPGHGNEPAFSSSRMSVLLDNKDYFSIDTTFQIYSFSDSVRFQIPRSALTDTGSYSVIVSLDPGQSLVGFEQEQTILPVGLSPNDNPYDPQIMVTINDEPVTVQETIYSTQTTHFSFVIQYEDYLSISDTGKVTFRINNQVIPIGDRLEFEETESGNRISFSTLQELTFGSNLVTIAVRMPAGPYSVSPKSETYDIRVSDQYSITEINNYPNPFSDLTRFYFILQGAQQPISGRLLIYTTNGLKIQTLDFQPKIGHNVVLWNGRDRQQEEIANGIYFYRAIVEFPEKTVSHTGKLMVLK